MRRWFFGCLVIIFFMAVAPAHQAEAGNLKYMNSKFDAQKLTRGEIYRIQAALSYFRLYEGTMDGFWNEKTSAALSTYTKTKHKSQTTRWSHAVALTSDFSHIIKALKWSRVKNKKMGLVFVFPSKIMSTYKSKKHGYFGFKTQKPGIDIQFHRFAAKNGFKLAQSFHKSYRTKKPDSGVLTIIENGSQEFRTEIVLPNGKIYLKSIKAQNGQWHSVVVIARAPYKNYYQLIRNSVTDDKTVPRGMPKKGFLADLNTLNRIRKVKNIGHNARIVRSNKPGANSKKILRSSGTGFYINKKGYILTNQHVIQGCFKRTVNDRPVTVIATSGTDDLAIIKFKTPYQPKHIAKFSPNAPGLNADVTVGGYPYSNILGGFNVTRGVISGRTGFKGKKTNWQISAALQSGNSGGAVVNKYGNVVGIAVSKLNALRVAKHSGDLPQNVNFAVKASAARKFLAENGIQFQTGRNKNAPSPEKLATSMDNFSVLIKCEREGRKKGTTVRYYTTIPGYNPYYRKKKYNYQKRGKGFKDSTLDSQTY